MKSSTGFSTARTVALRADQMPSGTAISHGDDRRDEHERERLHRR